MRGVTSTAPTTVSGQRPSGGRRNAAGRWISFMGSLSSVVRYIDMTDISKTHLPVNRQTTLVCEPPPSATPARPFRPYGGTAMAFECGEIVHRFDRKSPL